MEAEFWHRVWEEGKIGFHEREANPILVRCLPMLELEAGSRVFVPLCGKTTAIGWLLTNGYRVAGAELSRVAVEELFAGLGMEPEVEAAGELTHFRGERIDIFCGDYFLLTGEVLGKVDAVYDRAALVALPAAMRGEYARHLMAITGRAPQLLICYEYDQATQPGPPFSVEGAEVRRHYGEEYAVTEAGREEVAGGLRGKSAAVEAVWLLREKGQRG
jgi:thiopurine S-methyltransferase